MLVVSHGGALHAAHRLARGFMAPGRVHNCSASRLIIGPSPGGCARECPQAPAAGAAAGSGGGAAVEGGAAAAVEAGAGAAAAAAQSGRQQQRQQGADGAQSLLSASWAMLSWNEVPWQEAGGGAEAGVAAGAGFGGGANEA